MVMASSEKELQQQISEDGEKLLTPPASIDELLPLLDHLENCLAKVEQSPTKSMQNAIAPSQKALVADQLFKHSDVDVKVAVACCISEITRITAPDAPYDDDQMKDVFQLIVSSFENLSDKSSRSYIKRASILETVAKVRSCVVMLDLECDAMILEMFQHFLSNIRDYHPDNVFVSMETIMSLVLEESEEISEELLSPLLATAKKGNKEVLPIARKLGEKVLETCANKVKPYLQHAVKSLGVSLDDYSDVVASICQESSDSVNAAITAGENKVEESKPVEASPNEDAQAEKEIAEEAGSPKPDEPTNDKSPKSVVSNGVAQNCEDESLAESCGLKKQDDSTHADPSKDTDISTDADPKTLDAEKLVNDESKPEEASKKKGRKVNLSTKSVEPSESSNIDAEKDVQKPLDDKAASKDIPSSHEETAPEATVSSKTRNPADTSQPSSPKALEAESLTVASPSESENLPKADVSGKIPEGTSDSEAKPKKRTKKESLAKDSEPSADDAAKKTSEGVSDSEAKPNRRSSKKTPGKVKVSNEEKTSKTDTSKKETTNESEAKSLKKPSKKVDVSSNNGDESSLSPVETKKQRSRGKAVSDKNVSKSSTKDDDKVSSPKSAAKSTKNAPQLETPKTNNKRKHASGSEKGSDTQDNSGEDWVGKRVKVYWPKDKKYYTGTIDSYNASRKKQHKVVYDDGEIEDLNLKREKWEFIEDEDMPDEVEAADNVEADEPESQDEAPETPPKKKSKTSADQSAKDKVDSVKGKRASSSSKSKTAPTTKSARNPKDAKKTEDENPGKTKDTKSKSSEVASKSSSKSKTEEKSEKSSKAKDEETKTPKPSKQETTTTTKTTGKSKQENTPKNNKPSNKSTTPAGKSNTPAGKSKSGPKVKDTKDTVDDDNDNDSTDSDQPLETVKAKSKSQKGQAKKRRRV